MATPKCTPRIDFSAEFDTKGLEGKSAIVTGAGGGIGESIAVGLARAGFVSSLSLMEGVGVLHC